MQFAKSYHKGAVTMIEIMFVMVIIGIIMVTATKQFQASAIKSNAATISGSIRTLFNVVQEYYYQNCLTLPYGQNTVTFSQLQAANLLTQNDLVVDPLQSNLNNYTMTLDWNVAYGTWIITITYKLPTSFTTSGKGGGNLAQSYIALLNPSSHSGNTLTWQEAVGTNLATKNSPIYPLATTSSLYALAWYVDPSAAQNQYTGYYNTNFVPLNAKSNPVQSCYVRDRLQVGKP